MEGLQAGGEAAFWAGALQYALSHEAQLAKGEQHNWDPLQASLHTLQRPGAFLYAFPALGGPNSGQLQHAVERLHWLEFLLRAARERIADDMALSEPDAAMLKCACSHQTRGSCCP